MLHCVHKVRKVRRRPECWAESHWGACNPIRRESSWHAISPFNQLKSLPYSLSAGSFLHNMQALSAFVVWLLCRKKEIIAQIRLEDQICWAWGLNPNHPQWEREPIGVLFLLIEYNRIEQKSHLTPVSAPDKHNGFVGFTGRQTDNVKKISTSKSEMYKVH